jgi:hypothetical protein
MAALGVPERCRLLLGSHQAVPRRTRLHVVEGRRLQCGRAPEQEDLSAYRDTILSQSTQSAARGEANARMHSEASKRRRLGNLGGSPFHVILT